MCAESVTKLTKSLKDVIASPYTLVNIFVEVALENIIGIFPNEKYALEGRNPYMPGKVFVMVRTVPPYIMRPPVISVCPSPWSKAPILNGVPNCGLATNMM
jgi:hypothetical protein